MSKNYSLYKICNPGENHSVPLHSNQNFVLSVFDPNCIAELEYSSDFFELSVKEYSNGFTHFTFIQKYNLESWSLLSKVFLGEVIVAYLDRMGSLFVYLDNSENVLTLINPNSPSIKVNSNSIIEVVAYDDSNLGWDSTFISSTFGQIYRQIAYKKLIINQNNIVTDFPTVHRGSIFNFTGIEHHFWFKCIVLDFPNGSHYAGKIILSNESNENFRIVNVNVFSKRKDVHVSKIFSFGPRSNIAQRRNFGIIKSEISFKKRENSDLDDDCESFIMTFD